ncbi:MAG TPA: hypothetical protein VI299_03410 [Polyangiales bacterium]
MAELVIDHDDLVVHLSTLEKFGALHGHVRVSLTAVKQAWVATDPWRELRGYRAPGTGIPKVIMLGTTRGSFGKDFCAVYGRKPALVIELAAGEFNRLLISTPEPNVLAERVNSELPKARS